MTKTAASVATTVVILPVLALVLTKGYDTHSPSGNPVGDTVRVVTVNPAQPLPFPSPDRRYPPPGALVPDQGRLLSAVHLQYPSLRDVTVDCGSSRCMIQLSSRDVAGSNEREDIYKVATGDLDGLMERMGYMTVNRDVVVNDDDTTVVTLNTFVAG